MDISLWVQSPNEYYLKVENETLVAVKRCQGIKDFFSSREAFCGFFDVLFHREAYKFDKVVEHIRDNGGKYKDIHFIALINQKVSEEYNPKHEKSPISQVSIDSPEFISKADRLIRELKEKKNAWQLPEEITGDFGRGLTQQPAERSIDVQKLFEILSIIENESLPYAERKTLFARFLEGFSLTEEKLKKVVNNAAGHEQAVWQWRRGGCAYLLRLVQKFKDPHF